jgi:hypothetical protein
VTGYNVYTGDLLTGRIYARLPVVSSTWSAVMDDADTWQIVVQLGDSVIDAMEPVSNTSPGKNFAAVAYQDASGNETFLAGGPAWTHDYDDDTGQLTVAGTGMWGYFDHRKVMPVLAPTDNPATVTTSVTNGSLGTIAKRLVSQAQTHTGGNVPIVLPADEAGTFTGTYPGYELDWVGDMLRAITQIQNGPEVTFRPQRATDPRYLQWVMLVGTNENPYLSQVGADWIFDATVPDGLVSTISVHTDGSALADEAWVKGNGTAEGTIVGHQLQTTLQAQGYPLLEAEITGHEDAPDMATANGYAAGSLQFSNRPALTLTPKVDRDGDPNVSQYNVGDYVRIYIPVGHRYFPAGVAYRTRITGKSGDDSNLVTIQLATVPQ